MTSRDPLAMQAGITVRVIGDIERARRTNYDRATLVRIERALQWEPGSVDSILAGGEPTATVKARLPASDDDPLIGEIWADPALDEDQKLALVQIVRRANADRESVAERLRRARAG